MLSGESQSKSGWILTQSTRSACVACEKSPFPQSKPQISQYNLCNSDVVSLYKKNWSFHIEETFQFSSVKIWIVEIMVLRQEEWSFFLRLQSPNKQQSVSCLLIKPLKLGGFLPWNAAKWILKSCRWDYMKCPLHKKQLRNEQDGIAKKIQMNFSLLPQQLLRG